MILVINPPKSNIALIIAVILEGIMRIRANPKKRLPNNMPVHINALMSGGCFFILILLRFLPEQVCRCLQEGSSLSGRGEHL